MNAFDIKTQDSLSRVLRQVKTSDKDYEVFKKTFMRVVEMLGLTQYEYTFTKLKNCDDDAGVAFEKFGPGCIVHLAEEVSSVVYKRGMKSLALHEVLHLLFMDMETLALGSRKGLSEDKRKELFDRQTHYAIQRLVGAML